VMWQRKGKSRTHVYQHFKQTRRVDCSLHGTVLQSQFTPSRDAAKSAKQELQVAVRRKISQMMMARRPHVPHPAFPAHWLALALTHQFVLDRIF